VLENLTKFVVFTLQCEDLVGKAFISLSVQGRALNRYMELPVYHYIDERLNSARRLEFKLKNGKVLILCRIFIFSS